MRTGEIWRLTRWCAPWGRTLEFHYFETTPDSRSRFDSRRSLFKRVDCGPYCGPRGAHSSTGTGFRRLHTGPNHACGYPDSGPVANGNASSGGRSNTAAHADRATRGHADSNTEADGHADTGANSYASADGHTCSHATADGDSHARPDADANSAPDSHACTDPDACARTAW